ncbi:MAG: methyltransferase domain-containing protein [Rhodospirillales bacterium]|nr:methyltransferase domain-containing protein [Rhodospirillales bacterium]
MSNVADPNTKISPDHSYRNVVLAGIPTNRYPYLLMKHIFYDQLEVREGVVLDLGCGRGDQMAALEELGFDIIGIDREGGPNVTHICNFAENPLPLDDNSVDVVFSKSVIEHLYLPQIENYMKEIMRVLKPGGQVAIFTPDWIYCWDDYYAGFTHVTPFTTRSLGMCLEIYGFADVRTEVITQLPSVWHSRFFLFLADITRLIPAKKSWHKWIRWSKERQALGWGRKPAGTASVAPE